jgi:hypothetical protein
MEKTTTMTIRCSAETQRAAKVAAAMRECSISEYIRRLIAADTSGVFAPRSYTPTVSGLSLASELRVVGLCEDLPPKPVTPKTATEADLARLLGAEVEMVAESWELEDEDLGSDDRDCVDIPDDMSVAELREKGLI